MTLNELIIRQKNNIDLLNKIKANHKLNHAYIFEGEKGSGAYEAALYFACMVMCENITPCLECDTCKRVINNDHTNLQIVNPVNNLIKKEQITSLITEFTMSSLEEGSMSRLIIINDANYMNTSASNSLLKFLEEPVENRYLILVVQNKKTLLDTILSRCQVIHFSNTNILDLVSTYQKLNITKDLAYTLANFTTDIDEAKIILEDSNFKNIYNLAKNVTLNLNKNQNAYLSFYKDKDILNLDKKYHEWYLKIVLLMTEEHLKKMYDLPHFFDDINPKFRFKNAINYVIKRLDIYNNYYERFKTYVNSDLQYASMFIELERK